MSAGEWSIEVLTRRLAETPPDFLALAGKGRPQADVAAVLFDLVRALGRPLPDHDALIGFAARAAGNHQRLALIAAWLLHDESFRRERRFADAASEWLTAGLKALAAAVDARQFVDDADRREELVRLCLAALGLRPAGESAAQAEDRLTTLSSIERQKVVAAAKAAEARAREVRAALVAKAAAEAAAKPSRE